jgi:hypothetical protein
VPAGAPTVTRTDPDVNFTDDGTAGTNDFNLTNEDNFVVRWTGFVQAPITGTVTFVVRTDDGSDLVVGGQQIMSDWKGQGPTDYSGTLAMTQGQWYPLTYLYYEGGVTCQARLSWSYTGQTEIVIPSASLAVTLPAPAAPVLTSATAGVGQVTLAWTHSGTPAAAEFRVYMGTASGVYGGAPVATVPAGTLSTVITGLTDGTTYFFVVRAFASVESPNSNELAATPVPPTPRVEDNEEGLVDRNCGCGTAGLPSIFGWSMAAAGLLLLAFRGR